MEDRTLPTLPTGFEDEAGQPMRQAQDCLQRLSELLRLENDLLATLSHDARSPLTSIQFASQMGRMALSETARDLPPRRGGPRPLPRPPP